MPGQLLIVSTPIGNLGDLSERARAALAAADLVACEDTRRTGLLLHQLGIRRPMLSVHDHNERQRLSRIREALAAGQTIALASDAGTPLLSDPGYAVVRSAIEGSFVVQAVPGASAALAALVVSGLPPQPFTFAGFPPPKSGKRLKFYRALAAIPHTLIVYESPHRLLASLTDAIAALGDRPAAICRELTKLHEETLRGKLSELERILAARPTVKGEFVVVLGGGDAEPGATPGGGPNFLG